MRSRQLTHSRQVAADVGEDPDRLSIGNLHLGSKTRLLEEAGFRTLRDVMDINPAVLMRIPSVGRRTADQVVRNRAALREATLTDKSIDWASYCAAAGIPLIPAFAPEDAQTFIQSLDPFFRALADLVDDDVSAMILLERICQPPGNQKTLDQIGAAAVPALTRERVRQKERKLLGQITGGLLNDSYDGLDIHFHPKFARWWRHAADSLSDVDDIEIGRFIDLLASVWDLPQEAVTGQLPALLAVVTGEPQVAAALRSYTRVDPRLSAEGCRELRGTGVLKLRFGKAAPRLAERGLADVGQVIALFRSGGQEKVGGSAARSAAVHLDLLVSCIGQDGRFDWDAYRVSLGLLRLPATPPPSAASFVETLPKTLENLLSTHRVTMRAPDILRHRTGRDASSRMTLQQMSKMLDTHGPTIKREETLLLAWLNDVLVSREFFMLKVWVDEEWLTYWAEAHEIFERSGDDYGRFTENLAWRWRLTGREIRSAAPVMWAVFSGYPDGRRSTWQPRASAGEADTGIGRIRLQGFRRLH